MNCPNCALHIPAGSKFCKHCGIEISSSTNSRSENYTSQSNTLISTLRKGLGWLPAIFVIGLIILGGSSSSSKNATTPAGISNPPPPSCSNPPEGQTFNSLTNGYPINVISSYFNGQGQLKIKNGTDDDAVAKIIDTSTNLAVAEYYIDANNDYTISGVNDGNYNLLFSLGKNWSYADKKFVTCKSFSKFDELFTFITTYTQYTIFSVTLNPVIGGTARTTSIDESAFDKY